MIDDRAMNAYLSGYIAALRNRHRPVDGGLPQNPYVDDIAQRDGWQDGFKDASDEFGAVAVRRPSLPSHDGVAS